MVDLTRGVPTMVAHMISEFLRGVLEVILFLGVPEFYQPWMTMANCYVPSRDCLKRIKQAKHEQGIAIKLQEDEDRRLRKEAAENRTNSLYGTPTSTPCTITSIIQHITNINNIEHADIEHADIHNYLTITSEHMSLPTNQRFHIGEDTSTATSAWPNDTAITTISFLALFLLFASIFYSRYRQTRTRDVAPSPVLLPAQLPPVAAPIFLPKPIVTPIELPDEPPMEHFVAPLVKRRVEPRAWNKPSTQPAARTVVEPLPVAQMSPIEHSFGPSPKPAVEPPVETPVEPKSADKPASETAPRSIVEPPVPDMSPVGPTLKDADKPLCVGVADRQIHLARLFKMLTGANARFRDSGEQHLSEQQVNELASSLERSCVSEAGKMKSGSRVQSAIDKRYIGHINKYMSGVKAVDGKMYKDLVQKVLPSEADPSFE